MSGWAGFSDEELRRIQQKDSAVPAAASRARKPAAASRSRQQLQREKALRLAAQGHRGAPPPGASLTPPGASLTPPGASLTPPGQQLVRPPGQQLVRPPGASLTPPGQQLVRPPPTEDHVPLAVAPTGAPAVGQEAEQRAAGLEPAAHHQGPGETRTVKELDQQEVELREKTRLEQLQQEQKKMEERNKRKKALLAKTIAEKSKQTQAETVKLRRIQKELQALDDMVSNDIGILRNLIEEASWDYCTARKRYEKAEAEFVSAKLDLHRRTEVKEQLTEHLCAIIQQNELRKAQKLEELMQQLQLPPTEEEEEQRSTAAPENQGGSTKDEEEEQRSTAAPENQGAPTEEEEEQRSTAAPENQGAPTKDEEEEEQRGGEAPAEEDGKSLGEQSEAVAS